MSVQETDTQAFKERRAEVRIAVSLPATVEFVDRRTDSGKSLTLNCRAVNISPSAIAVTSVLPVSFGERVLVRLEPFGEFSGTVSRRLTRGFVLKFSQTGVESKALAERIHWFEKYKNHDTPEQRRAKRVVPRNPHSNLVWPDGRIERCLILNLSTSGAAVQSETHPEIGTVLALGRLVGRVVRLFEGGFAIQFVDEVRRSIALKSAMKNNPQLTL
jgi:hypothetical protein